MRPISVAIDANTKITERQLDDVLYDLIISEILKNARTYAMIEIKKIPFE